MANSDDIETLIKAIAAQTQAIGSLVNVLSTQNTVTAALVEIIRTSHGDHETRIRRVEETTTQLKERMNMWQVLQTAYSTVVGVIAGFFGRAP